MKEMAVSTPSISRRSVIDHLYANNQKTCYFMMAFNDN